MLDDLSRTIALYGMIGIPVVFLYVLPGFIASMRHHHNALAIWALTILAGWTAIGWIVAFVWSCTAIRHGDPQIREGRRSQRTATHLTHGTARRRFPGWIEAKLER